MIMLKVLLIDDEPIILKGLRTIIDWSSCGFEICGEAEDGRAGLEQIICLKPDLALVDIKMPEMNGLELVEQLKKMNMECRIIILTAYSDFKFAQKAIELGIDAYILKPIEESDLIEKLRNVHSAIICKKNEKQCLDQSISFSKERVLQNLMTGAIDAESVEFYNRLCHFGFPWAKYQVVLIGIEPYNQADCGLHSKIRCETGKFISAGNYGQVFAISIFTAILFKNMQSATLYRLLHQLQCSLYKSTASNIIISAGTPVDSYSRICTSYGDALSLIDKKFLYGHKKIIMDIYSDTAAAMLRMRENTFNTDRLAEELYNAIDLNNTEIINNLLENMKDGFLFAETDEFSIKSMYSNMYVMLMNMLVQSNEEIRDCMAVESKVMDRIYAAASLQELHGYFKYTLLAVSDVLGRQRPGQTVKKLLDYIDRNYYKDLKLGYLAELFCYSSVYLGKLIRQHAGMNFNAYLDSVRMKKAIELLKEGLKVYQVAEKTGFKDIDYFYRKFKRHTGSCPSEFKDR